MNKKFPAPLLLLFIAGFSAQFLNGPLASADVTLRAKSVDSQEPLTTEKIWRLDPLELNPHRKNWLVSRDIKIVGLRAHPLAAKGRYGATLEAVDAQTEVMIRAPGPWYQDPSDFGCRKEPNAWFSTQEGSRIAGQAGAKYWNTLLDRKRQRLSLLLNRIKESSPEKARSEAQRVILDWQLELETAWQNFGKKEAREAEWKHYNSLKGIPSAAKCKAAGLSGPSWEEIMEPVPAQTVAAGKEKLVARLPARRWNGLFTVRVSLDVGGKRLNGQFLLDSGSQRSFVAPDFLAGQGIPPEALVLKNLRPQKIRWAGGTSVARAVGGIRMSLGNEPIPFRDLLMTDAELFVPPQFTGTCCDGVLGIDFMRQYAVEFRVGPPYEVLIRPREGFHHEPSRFWTEVSTTSTGDLISASCLAVQKSRKTLKTPIVGARWDTGSEKALELHSSQLRAGSNWELKCGTKVMASDLVATAQNRESGRFSHGTIANVGIPVLGRGSVTLDLGHGRIWFSAEALNTPVRRNESGLNVRFRYDEARGGERYLNVESIASGSPAAAAARSTGLKAGVQLLQVDGKPTEKMDLWTVNQHLAGAFGNTVKVEWKVGKTEKEALLKLK